jgi:hypothetical protein
MRSRIDKNDQGDLADGLREFRRELEDFEDAQIFSCLRTQLICNMPSKSVVTSERIADTNDDNARHATLVSHDLVEHGAIGTEQLDLQGHLSGGVSGAAQAWIVSADDGFHAVQHSVGNFVPFHVVFRDL